MKFLTLLRISRPRFWLYLGGTYVLGAAAGVSLASELLSLQHVLWFLYFLIPANIVLYGINDLCDRDTDALNVKKGSKEHFLLKQEVRSVRRAVWLSVALGIPLLFFADWTARCALLGFFLLAWMYSAPPIRAKAKPFLDSATNVLYVLPGIAGYAIATDSSVSWLVVLGAAAWTMAMHLFSAIPDRTPDAQAGLQTTAVVLGHTGALALCALLWTIFAGAIIFATAAAAWSFASLLYVCIPLALLGRKPDVVASVYWYFPWLNALLGMAAFFALVPIP